jgi:hypothetical protein
MTYQISAPALHAARTLLRHFTAREKPASDIEFSERNLAILIDRYTLAWQVKAAVAELTQRISWLPGSGLESRIDELRDSVLALDVLRKKLPRYEDEQRQQYNIRDINWYRNRDAAGRRAAHYQVSATSVYAIRMIQEHYEFVEAPYGQMDCNEANMAGIIDVCTNIFRVQDALHRMCALVKGMPREEMATRMKVVRAALRALEIAGAYMPGYQPPSKPMEQLHKGQKAQIELSHEQKRNRQQVAMALSRTRSAQEALQVIDNARADKMI